MQKIYEKDEVKFEYTLKRSSRKASVGIQVKTNASVVVFVPKRFSEKYLNEILQKRSDWILEKQKKYSETFKTYSLHSGERIPYLGNFLTLQIVKEDRVKRLVFCDGQFLKVFLRKEDTLKELKREVLKWYFEQAYQKITHSVFQYQKRLGVSAHHIRIKNQKHRWGSCSSHKNINFNWRVLLLSTDLLDYVVVHELSHLVHLNHSSKFWQIVESVMPHYQQQRQFLKQKSAECFHFLAD